MRDKKGVSFPILLLVICTLLISVTGLIYFHSLDTRNQEILYTSGEINNIIIEKEVLGLYLEGVFIQSLKDFQQGESPAVFMERFRNELFALKDTKGHYPLIELETIASTLTEESIVLTENKLIMNIPIQFEHKGEPKITYSYNYHFEKIFKEDNV